MKWRRTKQSIKLQLKSLKNPSIFLLIAQYQFVTFVCMIICSLFISYQFCKSTLSINIIEYPDCLYSSICNQQYFVIITNREIKLKNSLNGWSLRKKFSSESKFSKDLGYYDMSRKMCMSGSFKAYESTIYLP